MANETEKLNAIFNQTINKYRDRMTRTVEKTRQGWDRVVYLITDKAIIGEIQTDLNTAIKDAGLYPKWTTRTGRVNRRYPEYGYYLEVTTQFNDGCPECLNNDVIFKIQGADE